MRHIVSAIFLKEYVKTRTCMAILFSGNAIFMGWMWLRVHRLFLQDHPEIVWYRVMDLGQIPWDTLTFAPLICGMIFCVFQFWPEMRDERLRISLHLPCGMAPLVLTHLGFGLTFLCLLFLLNALLLSCILSLHFPMETLCSSLLTAAPWFIAGLYAYLCTAWCILEPQRRVKSAGLILGLAICSLLTSPSSPGAFSPSILFFLLGLPLLTVALLLPALHYRHRRVQ